MVKCALMADAMQGEKVGRTIADHMLANFAVQGAAEEALVDQLLSDPLLMKDMLVAGCVIGGRYSSTVKRWAATPM